MSRLVLLGMLLLVVVVMWGLAFVSERFKDVSSNVAPLEARSFEIPSLVALGTGGTFENPDRLGPALAVGHGETLVLVDAGRGVSEALRRAEIPAWQPSHVLLTSLRPENTVGLDDLLSTGWLGPREMALEVVGPPGTAKLVAGLAQAHAAGLAALGSEWSLPKAGGEMRATELRGGERFEVGSLRVRAAALTGSDTPELAYRVEAVRRAVVVAGAGFDPEAVVALADGAGTLAIGAVYGASLDAALEAGADQPEVLRREAAHHIRLEDLAALGQRAGVRQIILVRLRPPPVFDFQYERLVGSNFMGAVRVASDGDTFALILP